MTITKLNTLLLVVFICTPLVAQVYKYVDENGNVTYSDAPPADERDLEPVDLPEIIYQPAVAVPENRTQAPEKSSDISVTINSPENNSTILGSASSFSISASTSRALSSEETVLLLVNGNEHSKSHSLNWVITDLIRGEYQLSIQILDKDNKSVGQSGTTTVYVQRNRARP